MIIATAMIICNTTIENNSQSLENVEELVNV